MKKKNTKKHLTLVVGARPNFMKMASLTNALKDFSEQFSYTLVHTGQHYDDSLSDVFFRDLNLPQPNVNFGVGSGSHAQQTGDIMRAFETHLSNQATDCVVVVGDVNSTLACTLVAAKAQIPVAHVEAGLESRDLSMPEEINRLATDAIAAICFCTTQYAVDNLLRRGKTADCLFLVGNTMVDTLIANLPRTKPPALWNECHLAPKEFAVCTLHRPSNVDQEHELNRIMHTIGDNAKVRVVFPVHPRTLPRFDEKTKNHPNILLTEPLGYLEFLHLTKAAKYVLTDSGGIQEETTYLGVPCLTLRENTERPETVDLGTNELVGKSLDALRNAMCRVEDGRWKPGQIPSLWDGKSGHRIVSVLCDVFS